MIEPPSTLYALTEDGRNVGYQVFGSGPVDIVHLPHYGGIDAIWDDPSYAAFLERLGRMGRVIAIDTLGLGSSDPLREGEEQTADVIAAGYLAVLDALKVPAATIVAWGAHSIIALAFMADHPERIVSAVLINGYARLRRTHDYPIGLSDAALDSYIRRVAEEWGTGSNVEVLAPSRVGDPAFRRWVGRYERLAVARGPYEVVARLAFDFDLRHALGSIQVPILMVNRRDSVSPPLAISQYVADRTPRGRLEALDGKDLTFFTEGVDDVADAIQEFITGAPAVREPDRKLAAILFTDIAGSTALASSMGDRGWTDLLDRHDAVVARELMRYDGRKVNPTGDGMLATFDSPARAVRCGQAIIGAGASLKLQIRAGVHVGEVEVRGQDIGGIAVHIGARVAADAAPGELVVTRTVVDLVAGSGLEFTDRGEHELKGVAGAWRLFTATGA